MALGILVLVWLFVVGVVRGGRKLVTPDIVDVRDASITLVVRSKWITIEDLDAPVPYNVSVHTRVYCWGGTYQWQGSDYVDTSGNEVCKVPGPTWLMQAGSTTTLVLVNDLVGVGVQGPSNENGYSEVDVTNMHVHGLHVDPHEGMALRTVHTYNVCARVCVCVYCTVYADNIWNVWTNPKCGGLTRGGDGGDCGSPGQTQREWTYEYEIFDSHYPGSHWYHAHWPRSVAYQVAGGICCMLFTTCFVNVLYV